MDADSATISHLSSVLFEQKRPVTFSSFSRDQNIHVNRAKIILHQFYKANTDQLQATFVVTGTAQDGSTLLRHAKTESSLAENVKLFKSVHTIHIYLLHLKGLHLTTTDVALEDTKRSFDLSNMDQYRSLGLIKGPELVAVAPGQAAKPVKSEPQTEIKRESAAASTAKPEKSAGLSSGYVSRKTAAAASSKPKSAAATKPQGYQYQSRKAAKRERVVQSAVEDHDEEMEEERADEMPRKQPTTDLNQLFLDDFSDDEKAKSEVEDLERDQEPTEAENREKPTEDSPQDADIGAGSATGEPEVDTPEPQVAATNFDEVDEDGYVVARKQSAPAKPAPKTAAARRAATPPTTSSAKQHTKKQKTQQSLMHFFGK